MFIGRPSMTRQKKYNELCYEKKHTEHTRIKYMSNPCLVVFGHRVGIGTRCNLLRCCTYRRSNGSVCTMHVGTTRLSKLRLNPRPAGPLDFPPPAGGRLNAPSPWSRLLVAVEKNERQRSKAREKSFRNHFGHFLAQVKIGVSKGQNSKIFGFRLN